MSGSYSQTNVKLDFTEETQADMEQRIRQCMKNEIMKQGTQEMFDVESTL
jgi:hypothetical protein